MGSADKLMATPGGHGVKVRFLSEKYPINQGMQRSVFVPMLDDSGLEFTAKCITERIDKKDDCPILVTGDRGSGKSTCIAKIARRIDPNFPVKNIAFTHEEFEKVFNENQMGDGKAKIYPQVWMDEAGHTMFGPEWLKQEQRTIAKMLIIGRIKQQILWFTVPKRKQLNNQVRNIPFIWLHITEPRFYEKGLAIFRIAPPERQSEWFLETYWQPKFAFVFTEETGSWWDEYEKRKIEFVNSVTAKTAENKGSRTDMHIRIIKNLVSRGWSQHQIAQVAECAQPSINEILAKNK